MAISARHWPVSSRRAPPRSADAGLKHMKFSQVPVGQRFEFQGDVYTKTGPVTARDDRSGRSRMIPRSGEVSLLGAGAAAPVPLRSAGLDPERVRAAVDRYHAAAEHALAADDPEVARAMLAAARAEFLAALDLD